MIVSGLGSDRQISVAGGSDATVLATESRAAAIGNLDRALSRGTNLPARFRSTAAVARAIEHGIAVWSEGKAKPYARKLYSILAALRVEERLLARHEPWELAFLKEETLIREESSAAQQTLAAVTARLDALEAQLKARIEKPRRACPRCGSTDMERIAVQTRSADEGMTMMLQCTSCQQRVRI
jgi:DNA-directed RNA polymerase subunit M/transcription elongation factor TFIIS